jgi:hypothetical protein
MRLWRKKNQNCVSDYARDYYQTHKSYFKKKDALYQARGRKELMKILGNKCILCGSQKKLRFHEIHGKPHSTHAKDILKHIEDFVPICQKCHRCFHTLIKKVKDINQIIQLLKNIQK